MVCLDRFPARNLAQASIRFLWDPALMYQRPRTFITIKYLLIIFNPGFFTTPRSRFGVWTQFIKVGFFLFFAYSSIFAMRRSPTYIIDVLLVTLLPGSVGLGLHLPGSPEPNSGCRSCFRQQDPCNPATLSIKKYLKKLNISSQPHTSDFN